MVTSRFEDIIHKCFNVSGEFLFADLLNGIASTSDEHDGVSYEQENLQADCLDHAYFIEEIR